ncbi:MAG TPA: YceI family protein [Actinomycetota bacterium]|jgi:polyisoprenoid-binding protein YceI|nr:YceI family protein [Actinomycetota bacterium]
MAQPAEQMQERTYQGVSIPPAGTYRIDPNHTSLEFVARHMLSKVRGSFQEFSGTITVGERPEESSIEVDVDTASVTTGTEQRDQHLHSSDFFEVEKHPTMTFASTAFRPTGGTEFEMDGDLTIRGVTKPVTLKGDFLGWGKDAWGNDRLFAEARTRVNREDWGLLWNMAVELTGVLVARDVDLEIQVQAARVTEE